MGRVVSENKLLFTNFKTYLSITKEEEVLGGGEPCNIALRILSSPKFGNSLGVYVLLCPLLTASLGLGPCWALSWQDTEGHMCAGLGYTGRVSCAFSSSTADAQTLAESL